MPYTVVIEGVPIQCETAIEAAELARVAGGNTATPAANSTNSNSVQATPGSRWSSHRAKQFLRLIKGNQRRLIDALLDTPDGQTDDQLCKLLGLRDGRALAGVFAGMYKNAKKIGADPSDLYSKERITVGDKNGWDYCVTDSFRAVASTARQEDS